MSKEHDVVVFDNEKRLEDVKKSRFWLLYLYGALDPKLRLRPLADTGLSNITLNWHEPSDSVKLLSTWTANFSRGITPIPVQLSQRLPSTSPTLRSPVNWLYRTRSRYMVTKRRKRPARSVALGILVNEQLEPLRQNGWLTHWNSSLSYVTTRPVTVVVSGMASFEWWLPISTYRDIFFDAPLYDIENPQYDVTNSFYASADIKRAVGKKLSLGKFNSHQRAVIKRQIAAASKKGLKARYWVPSGGRENGCT
ncbi:hypothetical protein B0O99DRAFT_682081 [Bisporella sp. PMI_857]|nr:hypothetical protein B0O99DRAFT_682081 [Bisporella sp. PMI_857]